MVTLKRTDAKHPDFVALVAQLDRVLAILDGEEHDFYAQYNTLDHIKHVVLAYEEEQAVACGAIKPFDAVSMEVKRMYTLATHRGRGIATQVLSELEQWAAALSYQRCVLETGLRQADAIHLYEKNGYSLIPNYGQYVGVANSRCFAKTL